MKPVSPTIDRVFDWLKWPVAIAALLLLPGSVLALVALLKQVASLEFLPFLGGAVFYFILWRLVLRRRIFGSYFSTLEHELTHAIFAWATLHRVTGIRSTWNQGGRITYMGKGNWLITIAPYFFPTLCCVLAMFLVFLPTDGWFTGKALMGAALVYHITSTRSETHGAQTDLQKVGFPFAWSFLPTANLIALGIVLAFSSGGIEQTGAFLDDVIQQSIDLVASPSAVAP